MTATRQISIAALLLFVAACGSSSDDSSSATTEAVETTETTEAVETTEATVETTVVETTVAELELSATSVQLGEEAVTAVLQQDWETARDLAIDFFGSVVDDGFRVGSEEADLADAFSEQALSVGISTIAGADPDPDEAAELEATALEVANLIGFDTSEVAASEEETAGDPAALIDRINSEANLRTPLADIMADQFFYDRVNTVAGEADDFGFWVKIDGTSGYGTEERQQEKAIEVVDWFAKNFWPEIDQFTPLGLRLVSDGRTYNIPPDQLVAIAELRVSAQEAMGL